MPQCRQSCAAAPMSRARQWWRPSSARRRLSASISSWVGAAGADPDSTHGYAPSFSRRMRPSSAAASSPRRPRARGTERRWRTGSLLAACSFEHAGALRRSAAALSGHRGRAFRMRRGSCSSHERRRPPSANLSRGVVVPPGGSRRRPGLKCLRGTSARASHPAPPSNVSGDALDRAVLGIYTAGK